VKYTAGHVRATKCSDSNSVERAFGSRRADTESRLWVFNSHQGEELGLLGYWLVKDSGETRMPVMMKETKEKEAKEKVDAGGLVGSDGVEIVPSLCIGHVMPLVLCRKLCHK
jgi:hypothetical protein